MPDTFLDPETVAEPFVLASVLNDARVQDCLWVGLMEWDLRIEKVALRPRTAAEGGAHPDGWVLWIGLGPGVRLEVVTAGSGEQVEVVRLVVRPERAPELVRRSRFGGSRRKESPHGGTRPG